MDIHLKVIEYLTNGKAIKKGNIFPLQFFSAMT